MAPFVLFHSRSSERGFAHVAERLAPQAGSLPFLYKYELAEHSTSAPVLLERRGATTPQLQQSEPVVNFPTTADSVKALAVIIVVLSVTILGVAAWKIRAWRRRRRAHAGIDDPEVPPSELSPLPEKIESEKRRLSMNKRTIIDFNFDTTGLQFPTPPKAARLLPPSPPPGVGWVPQYHSLRTQRVSFKSDVSKRDSDTSSDSSSDLEKPKSTKSRTTTTSSRLSKMLSAARKSKASEASFDLIPPVPPLPYEVQSNRSSSSSSSSYTLNESSDDDSLSSESSEKKKKKKLRSLAPVRTDVRGKARVPTVIVQDEVSPALAINLHSPAPPSYRAEPLRSPSRHDSIIMREKPITPIITPKSTATTKKQPHHTRSSSSTDVGRVKRLPRLVTVIQTYAPNPDHDDEMHIKIGDILRLSEEFKDGWCRVQRLGSKDRRRSRSVSSKGESLDEGVIPQFCVQDRPDFVTRHSFSPLASGTFPRPFRLGAR